MPTANANTGNGFNSVIGYVLQERILHELSPERRPQILERNLVIGDKRAMSYQMREIAMDRPRITKPVLHFQINFHPEEQLFEEKAKTVVQEILNHIGVDSSKHQYLLVQHNDKAHRHYHVVMNRVGFDGKPFRDSRIIERLQVACDKVEQELGLRRTPGRMVVYDPSQEKGYRYIPRAERTTKTNRGNKTVRDKNVKKETVQIDLQETVRKILSDIRITHVDSFKSAMEAQGVEVQLATNKNGIYGISFRTNEISTKGTVIGYKWSDISSKLNKNLILSSDSALRRYISKHAIPGNHTPAMLVNAALQEVMHKLQGNQYIQNQQPLDLWQSNKECQELFTTYQQYAETLLSAPKTADQDRIPQQSTVQDTPIEKSKEIVAALGLKKDKAQKEVIKTSAEAATGIPLPNKGLQLSLFEQKDIAFPINPIENVSSDQDESPALSTSTQDSVRDEEPTINTSESRLTPSSEDSNVVHSRIIAEQSSDTVSGITDQLENKDIQKDQQRTQDIPWNKVFQRALKQYLMTDTSYTVSGLQENLKKVGVSLEYLNNKFVFRFKDKPTLSMNVEVYEKILAPHLEKNYQILIKERPSPEPNPREQEELTFYNGFELANEGLIHAFTQRIQAGKLDFEIRSLFEHFGFQLINETRFKFEKGDLSILVDSQPYLDAIIDLRSAADTFRKETASYDALMKQKPEQVPLDFGIFNKSKRLQIEQRNEALQVRKERAVRPCWKPTIEVSKLRFHRNETSYEIRLKKHKASESARIHGVKVDRKQDLVSKLKSEVSPRHETQPKRGLRR